MKDPSGASSAAQTETVTVQPPGPAITTSTGSASFTAGDNTASTPVVIDANLSVTKRDGASLTGATVKIANGATGDLIENGTTALAANGTFTTASATLTYTYVAAIYTLTISGSDTAADYQTLLRGLSHTSSLVKSDTATRRVDFTATDGQKTSALAKKGVTVADADQTPVLTASGGTTAAYKGGGAPAVVDAGVRVSDGDNATLSSATVTIANAQPGDLLGFTNDGREGNIAGSYAGGVLTLTSAGATATVAQFQAALDAVTFSTASPRPDTTARIVTFAARDGQKTGTAPQTDAVTVADAVPVDTMSIDGQVSYSDGVFTLTGRAASTVGVRSVEISAVLDDGLRHDLGAAALNADGTFTFADAIGAGSQTFLAATSTDATGGQATSQDPGFNLAGGLGRFGTAGRQENFGPTGQASTTFFRPDGRPATSVAAPGQTIGLQGYGIVSGHRQGDTTFLYTPSGEGGAIDVVRGFEAGGADHDVLSLVGADFNNSIADVLRHTGDVNGSAFVTDPVTGDAIRLAGVSKADLRRENFAFHG